jgi:WD40 repeat protein
METSVDEHGVQSEQSRALRERIEAHALPVRDCAFTQDERCLVTASADQTVRVHDLQSEVSRTRTVCELDSAATTLCIAPLLNDTVFCGTQSGCIFEAHLQDASASGRVFKGHSKGVTAVWCAALRLNDSSLVRLVSSSLDGDVRVWDVASALTVSRIAVHNAVLDVTVFRSVPHAAVSRLALGEAAKQSASQSRSVVHRFNKLPTESDDVVVRLTGRAESGSFFDLDQAGTDGNTNDAEADLKAERDQLWAANKRLCLRLLNKALNGS